MNRQQIGTMTAKAGFLNEQAICQKFIQYKTDDNAQIWLGIMGYKVEKIQSLSAIHIPTRISKKRAEELGITPEKHDETIKYHSDVTVEQALEHTIYACKELGYKLIVKGHPVNPGSMASLKAVAEGHQNVIWLDDVSIHDLIPNAKAVVVVNSGTGMESLLRLKNVVTFGRAEYNCVANALAERSPLYQDPIKDVVEAISNEENVSEYKIKKFFDGWCKWTIDTSEKSDFSKL